MAQNEKEQNDYRITYYNTVSSKEVDWLWYPYIPYGKITILQGDPGEGKSTMMMQLAALITNGDAMPDGSGDRIPGNVIYQAAEDGIEDTIKPRLEAAGADCSRMYINHKYSYRGHVFESRYKSCLVKEDTYFLQTSRYIHLNPVKARMVTHPEEYLWSSYQTVIGIADDRITEKEKTLAYFSKNSVFYYREFVEDIGYKYIVQEQHIRKMIGEEELWLPW